MQRRRQDVNNFREGEKGVSLITAFFIMTIILALILAISSILYSEIKIIRNMGYSVVAFYAADSGVEKILYYNRKAIPEDTGWLGIPIEDIPRGLCFMCDTTNNGKACQSSGTDASECSNCNFAIFDPGVNIDGCDVDKCNNCEVSFDTAFDGKEYSVTARVFYEDDFINFEIDSKGKYRDIERGVETITRKFDLSP